MNKIYRKIRQLPLSDPKRHEIQRDISRTFPYLDDFATDEQIGRKSLYDVLHCVSVAYPEIGYCQGMNFLASQLLLFMSEEVLICFFSLRKCL